MLDRQQPRRQRLRRVARPRPGSPPGRGSGRRRAPASPRARVQPCTAIPAASARAWVSSPGKSGRIEGWMFSIRPAQAAMKPGVSTRMKPARQRISAPLSRERPRHRRLEGRAVAAEGAVVDRRRRQPQLRRPGQAAGVGPVGEDEADLAPDGRDRPCRAPAPACSSRRPRSGSATRRRLTDGPSSARPPRARRGRSRSASRRRRRAASASASGALRRDHRDQADAAVEGLQHLGVGDPGLRRAARRRPAAAARRRGRSRRRAPSGRIRGRFSVSPPPVMCARPCTPPARIAASAGRT